MHDTGVSASLCCSRRLPAPDVGPRRPYGTMGFPYLHLPVTGFKAEPIAHLHDWSGRHIPWIDEILGSSLHV